MQFAGGAGIAPSRQDVVRFLGPWQTRSETGLSPLSSEVAVRQTRIRWLGLTIRKSARIGIAGEIRVNWHRPLPAAAEVKAAVVCRSAGRWSGRFLTGAQAQTSTNLLNVRRFRRGGPPRPNALCG
jgi:hypothetical protein